MSTYGHRAGRSGAGGSTRRRRRMRRRRVTRPIRATRTRGRRPARPVNGRPGHRSAVNPWQDETVRVSNPPVAPVPPVPPVPPGLVGAPRFSCDPVSAAARLRPVGPVTQRYGGPPLRRSATTLLRAPGYWHPRVTAGLRATGAIAAAPGSAQPAGRGSYDVAVPSASGASTSRNTSNVSRVRLRQPADV